MAGYTQQFTQLKNTARDRLEEKFLSDEERARKQIQRFRNGGVYGTTNIDPSGAEMVEIAARFIDNTISGIEDPAFDGIQFQIDWNDPYGLFSGETPNGNFSALDYLRETGETERHDRLVQVIRTMHELFDAGSKLYYVQSIDGLGALNENLRHVGIASDINLHCYDDIKWTIRSLKLDLEYIFYDRVRQIEVLPKNLRRFSCYISISDIRDMRTSSLDANNAAPGDKLDKAYAKAQADSNAQQSFYVASDSGMAKGYPITGDLTKQTVLLTCPSCYFNGLAILPDQVSNVEQEELAGDLPIKVFSYHFSYICPALQKFILQNQPDNEDEASGGGKQSLGKKLWQAAKNYGKAIVANAINTAVNTAKSYAMQMAYGALEKTGILDTVNDLLKFTKPSLLMAQYGRPALDDLLGLSSTDLARAIYQPNLGIADYTNGDANAESAYKESLGTADYTNGDANAESAYKGRNQQGENELGTADYTNGDANAESAYDNDLGNSDYTNGDANAESAYDNDLGTADYTNGDANAESAYSTEQRQSDYTNGGEDTKYHDNLGTADYTNGDEGAESAYDNDLGNADYTNGAKDTQYKGKTKQGENELGTADYTNGGTDTQYSSEKKQADYTNGRNDTQYSSEKKQSDYTNGGTDTQYKDDLGIVYMPQNDAKPFNYSKVAVDYAAQEQYNDGLGTADYTNGGTDRQYKPTIGTADYVNGEHGLQYQPDLGIADYANGESNKNQYAENLGTAQVQIDKSSIVEFGEVDMAGDGSAYVKDLGDATIQANNATQYAENLGITDIGLQKGDSYSDNLGTVNANGRTNE